MANLENHQILSSKDLHEMRDLLTTLTSTDEVDVIGHGHDVDASLRHASFSDINLFHVTYGHVPTRVHAYEHDDDAFMLFILTGGAADVRHKGEEFTISADTALMRDARLPTMARQEAFASFAIPFSIDSLKQHVVTLVGEEAYASDIKFNAKVDMNTPGGRHLRDTVSYIADALDGPLRNLDQPMLLDSLKDLLFTSVLTLLPNSCTDLLQCRSTVSVVPYYVKRARDYIHAHAASAITLQQLTGHAGCGYRTLQVAFNDAYGMPPMSYVKFVRLNGAHSDLLFAEDGVTVSDVASKWGFVNVGRFAQSYMKQFGIKPSQTLRTRR